MYTPTTLTTLTADICKLWEQLGRKYTQAEIKRIYRIHIDSQPKYRGSYYKRQSAIKKLQAIYHSLKKELRNIS